MALSACSSRELLQETGYARATCGWLRSSRWARPPGGDPAGV